MSALASPILPDLGVPPPAVGDLVRLTVEQYDAMIEHGVLGDADQVELLAGWLVANMAKTLRHTLTIDQVRETLGLAAPSGWFALVEGPLHTSHSVPEPDVMLVRGTRKDYAARSRIVAGDVGLVVEVADSSLARDMGLKREIYAKAGVPCLWVANLVRDRLEVFSQPRSGDYSVHQSLGPANSVDLVLDGAVAAKVNVADLLPQ